MTQGNTPPPGRFSKLGHSAPSLIPVLFQATRFRRAVGVIFSNDSLFGTDTLLDVKYSIGPGRWGGGGDILCHVTYGRSLVPRTPRHTNASAASFTLSGWARTEGCHSSGSVSAPPTRLGSSPAWGRGSRRGLPPLQSSTDGRTDGRTDNIAVRGE